MAEDLMIIEAYREVTILVSDEKLERFKFYHFSIKANRLTF